MQLLQKKKLPLAQRVVALRLNRITEIRFLIGGRIMYDYDSYDGAYNADFDGDSGFRIRVSSYSTNPVKGTSG